MKNNKHTGSPQASAAKESFSPLCLIRSSLIGLAIMALSSLILLLVGAGVAYGNSDPAAFYLPLSVVALYIGMFAGGFGAARIAGENKLLTGLIYSALAFVLLFLLKLVLSGGNGESINGSGAFLTGALASAICGSLATAFRSGKKSPMKKKKTNKFSKKK